MMLRTPVCSYPIIVTHLSFNFRCLLLLYSIYLNGYFPPASQAGRLAGPVFYTISFLWVGFMPHRWDFYSHHRNYASMVSGVSSCFRFSLRALPNIENPFRVHTQKELISDLNRFPFFVKEIRRVIE